jgi:hypothetical protein
MPRINFDASNELKNRLESYSENQEVSQAGVARMALNQFLPEENL